MTRELCFWALHDLCHSDHLFHSSARHGIMPNFRCMESYCVWEINKLYLYIYTDENFSFKISVRGSRKQFSTHYLSLVGRWGKVLSLLQKNTFSRVIDPSLGGIHGVSSSCSVRVFEGLSTVAMSVPGPALDFAFSAECLDLGEQLEDSQSETAN